MSDFEGSYGRVEFKAEIEDFVVKRGQHVHQVFSLRGQLE
jgi:hypothetical protein